MIESEELNLLVALTHPEAEQQQKLLTDCFLKRSIDWDTFLSQMQWHRVTPQVCHQLSSIKEHIPQQVTQQIYQANLNCQRISLKQSAWLVKITQLFNSQQIRCIVLKGVALSQLLYSDSGKRQCKDLDLLIDQADLMRTEALLTQNFGFERLSPAADATDETINYLNCYKKDRIYRHPHDNTLIELHWRFINEQPFLLVDFSDLFEQSQSLSFHQQNIKLLGYQHLWLYQALHGTYTGWYRLHWLSDIAEMLVQNQPDWETLLASAKHYHCKRCLVETVALAGRIYNLPVPAQIKTEMQKSWQQQLSVPLAMRLLAKTQTLSSTMVIWRHFLWMPKKQFLYYMLLKVKHMPFEKVIDFRQQPIRSTAYYLFHRPASLLIKRFY
jgi:hypothetical protein